MTVFQETRKNEAMTGTTASITEGWQSDRHCAKSSQGVSLQKPLIQELLESRVTDVMVTKVQGG